MKLPLDARFIEESRTFSLRFECETCGLFDDVRATCAHGYPTDEHIASAPERRSLIVFCKEYEMA